MKLLSQRGILRHPPGGLRMTGPARWRSAALLAVLLALAPGGAAAHVKWFEDASRYPLRPDLILSDRTAVLVGGS